MNPYTEFINNHIYIPHWLDSMKQGFEKKKDAEKIYIPHWLDSMFNTSISF